jgi:hypothetical protein
MLNKLKFTWKNNVHVILNTNLLLCQNII